MKLKEYLKTYKLSQKDLALRIGVSQAHISQILCGKKNPSIQLIKRIEIVTNGSVLAAELLHPKAPSRLKNKDFNIKLKKIQRG